MPKAKSKIQINNRRASHDYEFLESYDAGIVLVGTEIKSLRWHDAGINDAYIYVKGGEAFISNMHIAPYKEGNIFNVDHLRDRKLLLNKKEIKKLGESLKTGGYTCVPTKLFLQHGYAKLEIALAKGKKLYDKRESIKERDQKRMIEKGKGGQYDE